MITIDVPLFGIVSATPTYMMIGALVFYVVKRGIQQIIALKPW